MYKNILILPDGTEISSGVGTVHAIRSLTLTEMVNSGPELTLGSCCSDMLEATLFTPGGLDITAGTALTLFREGPQGRVKMGVFTVEAPTRPSPNTMKLTGFDNTARLDRDLTPWLESLTGWPYGFQEFARLVCGACDLTYRPQTVPNGDFTVEKWMAQGATGRQIMAWLGQIASRYVHADPDGCIAFGWYAESGKTLAPSGENHYFSLSYENYTVAPIDTVQMRLGAGQSGAPWPPAQSGDNAYVLPRNPILGARVTTRLLHYLDTIHSELMDLLAYTPCTVTAPADPHLRPGNILDIQTARGPITMYIMEKTSTGQKDTYRCTGNHRRAPSTDQMAQTLTQENIFNALTQGGADQGLYLQDGKVYINAQYLMAGSLSATGEIFLDPGFPEAQAIKNHITGLVPLAEPEKYDFNGDGEVTVSDMLIAQRCALGQLTLTDWAGAQATPVTVTLDPANAQKVISIRGTNMWGREVEHFIGFQGAGIGRLLGDLVIGGKILLGEAALTDTLPAASTPGQLIFVKEEAQSPWTKCQCYIGT